MSNILCCKSMETEYKNQSLKQPGSAGGHTMPRLFQRTWCSLVICRFLSTAMTFTKNMADVKNENIKYLDSQPPSQKLQNISIYSGDCTFCSYISTLKVLSKIPLQNYLTASPRMGEQLVFHKEAWGNSSEFRQANSMDWFDYETNTIYIFWIFETSYY
jgi:hypothetical protein